MLWWLRPVCAVSPVARFRIPLLLSCLACAALALVAAPRAAAGAPAPSIVSVTASQTSALPGERVTITASTVDATGGGLTFSWSASGGTVAGDHDPDPERVTWTAPAGVGPYTITVSVMDAAGQTASSALTLQVVWARAPAAGSAIGQGLRPTRVAVDPAGRIYVSDAVARSVRIFTPLGQPLGSVQLTGVPGALAVDGQGRIFVGDLERREVAAYDAQGTRLLTLGKGAGEFRSPIAAVHDPATGRLYVADGAASEVLAYSSTGTRVLAIPLQGGYPAGLALRGGNLLVSDGRAGLVREFASTGAALGTFGTSVPGGSVAVTRAGGVARGPDGSVYLVDSYQARVAVFDPRGLFVAYVGGIGAGPGQLRIPVDVVVDGFGRLLVSSSDNGRLEIFETAGSSVVACAGDRDCDGMPDVWEASHGLDPQSPADALADPDQDSLVNVEEFKRGTEPKNADTDGDGRSDGEELKAGTNPTDPSDNRPVAAAGRELTTEPTLVALDGSGSTDPNGDKLTYEWTLFSGPGAATLRGADGSKPSVVLTTAGVYEFQLRVGDGRAFSPATKARVTVLDVAPTADAGPDLGGTPGRLVALDGHLSSDANGDGLSWSWKQVAGAPVTLERGTEARAAFVPPSAGLYAFELVVSDGTSSSLPDRVNVVVDAERDHVPVAMAAELLRGVPGRPVTLDGRRSVDTDEDALAYSWRQVSGAPVAIDAASTAQATFTPASPGVYRFVLVVKDRAHESLPRELTVVVDETGAAAARAQVGPASRVKAREKVTLSCEQSRALGGAELGCTWRQLEGVHVPLASSARAATFVPIEAGTYRFELELSGGPSQGLRDRVTVVVDDAEGNAVPVPIASAPTGTQEPLRDVTLDGTASLDPNDDAPLEYTWTQVAGPRVILSDVRAARPTLSKPVRGLYLFELRVSDGPTRSPAALVRLGVGVDPGTDLEPEPPAPAPVEEGGCGTSPGAPRAGPLGLLVAAAIFLWVTGRWRRRGRSRRARAAALSSTTVAALLLALAGSARAADPPHDPSQVTKGCADCHVVHNAPGYSLTSVLGNATLCQSCHVSTGSASALPFGDADQASAAGTRSSHSWSGSATNPNFGAAPPTDPQVNLRLSVGSLTCSACHNQHLQAKAPFDPVAPSTAGSAGRHFLRADNASNELCLDCHAAWRVNALSAVSYTGANLSHPVEEPLPGTDETFFNPPRDVSGGTTLSGGVASAASADASTLTDGTKSWGNLTSTVHYVRFKSGLNKGLTRLITGNTATSITFAAVTAAPALGDAYEIDGDANATNNLPLTSAGKVVCQTCHSPHFADSNSSTYDDQPRPGDGKLLRRTNDGTLCTGCHKLQVHNSANTGSGRAPWGMTFDCSTCHQPHKTPNIYLVRTSILTPNSGARAVDFRTFVTGQENYGLVNAAAPGTGPCETCHTDTRNGPEVSTPGTASFTAAGTTVTGAGTSWNTQLAAGWEIKLATDPPSAWTPIASVNGATSLTLVAGGYRGTTGSGASWRAANPRFRNTGSGRGATGSEHYVGKCTDCHSHAEGFKASESRGNANCSCHNFGMEVAEASKGSTYHHVIESKVVISGGLTSYPTGSQPTVAADEDKTCVSCHVDHNVFRADVNASNALGRGANLRSRIGTAPAAPPSTPNDTTGYFWNADYDASFAGGGLCLSCHTQPQTKDNGGVTPNQKSDGTAVTPALVQADYAASAHDYAVEPQGAFSRDGKTFSVSCVKCHNSDTPTNYQSGAYKFALHTSVDRRLRAPLGMTSPTDPFEEKFCFRCHSAATDTSPGGGPAKATALRDYYNATAMTARSEGLYAVFQHGFSTLTTTTNTLYFKPTAAESPAEAMPNAHQTADTMAGGTWIGRSMSPGTTSAAMETKSQATNLTGARYWNMVTFTSPAVASATSLAAGNWTIYLYARRSSTNQAAYVRYMIYKWNANDSLGTPTIVAKANYGTQLSTSTAPGSPQTITVAGSAVSLAVGDKLSIDLELYTNSSSTTSYTASYYFGSGAASYLRAPAPVTFNYASPPAGSRHRVDAYAGLHKPNPAEETQAYISANKHVECEDCHNPHASGAAVHVKGTNLVSAVLKGVSGAIPTFAATNWTAPTGYSFGTATKEHEICFKCHSAANTGLASWNSAWTDVGREFSPANGSYHPVAGALPATDPGANGSKRLVAAQLTGWTPGQTMYCSDCHGNSAAAPAAQGPHGSAVDHLLSGVNTRWPTQANGTTLWTISNRNTSAGTADGLFCLNCHPATTSSVNSVHGRSDHNSAACVNCHILVPHGGKLGRLIGDRETMPSRYAYGGVLTNMWISGFTRASSATSYQENNCYSLQSGCTTHNGSGTESW